MFALMFCRSLSLVKDLDGNQIYGLFDHMKKGEQDNFEAHLSDLSLWATQCQNANISAGKYFAVSPIFAGVICSQSPGCLIDLLGYLYQIMRASQ